MLHHDQEIQRIIYFASDIYLKDHGLPNENDYYDPTKVHGNRECGLHTQ